MKLNKLQRYTAYCIMLEEADILMEFRKRNDRNGILNGIYGVSGFCDIIQAIWDGDFSIGDFPEIITKRPQYAGIYWWPTDVAGWEIRISILKCCIGELESEIWTDE